MTMKIGDIVRLKKVSTELGIVLWKHPTKEVARIYWTKDGLSLERCGRLEIILRYDSSQDPKENTHKL